MNIPQSWSLLEMIELFALKFCQAYHQFRAHQEVLLRLEKEDRIRPIGQQVFSVVKKQSFAEFALYPIMTELDRLQFSTELRTKAKMLYGRLADRDRRTWTAESLFDAFSDLNGDISRELNKHKFFKVRIGGEHYLDNISLFGNEVFKRFKAAQQDIKDAGNCFATEMYTASVFHLMRVVEHGFRTIAKRYRVKISDKGKDIPLEYGDWTKVISAIEGQIKTIRAMANTQKKEARLNYYSDAIERCSAMKDLYRNPVSHTRTQYNEGEALGVMARVRDFMQMLARPIPR